MLHLHHLLHSQIGIIVPRRDQSRADGAVGTGESLICPIASPYLNTLLIFILSDTSFLLPLVEVSDASRFYFLAPSRHFENFGETVFVFSRQSLILKYYY
jgi:hypothetical protein